MEVSPFGELLTTLRTQHRISQQELARKLDVHRNTISKWECGICLPESKTLVLEIARQLRLDAQDTRRLLEASLTALSPYWQMPYPRNPFFTGREEVLQRLRGALHHDHSAILSQSYALSGLGGIGKTQTAIEYAYRYAADYSAVFWLSAETSESLLSSLMAIADLLDLPERRGQERSRVVAAVIRWLNTHSGWLLILDNVEDPDVVKRVLPAARSGALLLTSRRQALGLTAQTLDLEQMTPEEGTHLLLQRARLLDSPDAMEHLSEADWTCAHTLVTLMGGLPLALDQAGAYIEATRCSLSDYLYLFQAAQLRLLDERAAHADHPLSVTRTFVLAFAQLEQRNPAAAELLTVCAFLAPEAIPEDMFMGGAALLGPTFEVLAADPLQFQAAIKDLLTYSLVQRDATSHTLTVHRLVQAILLDVMTEAERGQWNRLTIKVLDAVFPEVLPSTEYATWESCERLLPHVLASLHREATMEDILVVASLASKSAHYLGECGRYAEAEALSLRALQIRERVLGPDHPDVGFSLNHLAGMYLQQGKYAEAEPLWQRALHLWGQALGPDHPDVARPLNNLSNLYRNQGKYEEAKPLLQRALHLWEQALGPDHPFFVTGLHNLATLYQLQGRYEEAEQLIEHTLSIRERLLGPEHPEVARSLTALADLYIEQGKYEGAEACSLRALRIREQTLGPDHPLMADSLTCLAIISLKQGKDAEAECLFQRALSIREDRLGPHHPATAQTLHDLALLRQRQGNLREVASLAERALKIRTQSLGETHPKTVATRTLYTQLQQEQVSVEERGSAW